MAYSSPSLTKPMATPATEAFSGTPASIMLSEPPQTVAIDDEPFDSRMSETTRIAYGQSASLGSTAETARSASAPWPISRRPAPRRNATSPTEKGALFAISKEEQQMQRDIAQLQSQIQQLQSAFDTQLATLQTLASQALDAAGKANTNVSVLNAGVTSTLERAPS